MGSPRRRGEWIVALDADARFEPEPIAHLVAPLADPRVGAVAGDAKVGNRVDLVTRWQAVEYVTSPETSIVAPSRCSRCVAVVPGAVGAHGAAMRCARREASAPRRSLRDQDLALPLSRQGYRIAYADDGTSRVDRGPRHASAP
ncbi:MAG: glycosyltransferase family 2 protein [Gemmatimonadales bacterium]